MRSFSHSVNVLVKAYLNETLEHHNCHACAVGNLIADGLGIGYTMFPNNFKNRCRWSTHPIDEPFWTEVFVTEGRSQYIRSNNYLGIAKKEIDSTGYSWQELARIERAFESIHRPFNDIDAYNFNGLMAVVDVLAEIHGISLEETAAAKSLFVK